jgi:cell wall assembly regulator SMI1
MERHNAEPINIQNNTLKTHMKTKITFPETIDELLNHPKWDGFIGSKLGNDLFINDPERAERIHEAAEYGSDGSTHYEIIEDWREFADMLFRSLPWDEREELEPSSDVLHLAINQCEEWHEKNGTLHKQVG